MEYSTWVTLSMCTSFICLTNGTNWSNVHNVPQSIRSSGITIRCHMSAANSKQMGTPKNIIKIIVKKKNKKTWMRSVAPVCRFLLFAAYIAQVIAINHPAAIVFRARFTKQICLPVINNSRRLASPALEKYRWITVPVWPPINGRTSISSQLWAPYSPAASPSLWQPPTTASGDNYLSKTFGQTADRLRWQSRWNQNVWWWENYGDLKVSIKVSRKKGEMNC